ncbi:MAG: hypothetical protein MUQ52_06265 [Pirellulales bacterium]|nr:hypothetical protein [Pirellulales bacterium]
MARISVRNTVFLKIFSALQLSVVSSYFLIIAIPQVTGSESLTPDSDEKHWVSKIFDNFTAATDALQWSDIRVVSNWRIQQHVQSKSYRLLDSDDHVVLEGTLKECSAQFSSLMKKGDIDPVKKEAVIVLHGLGEGRSSMKPLVTFLEENMTASILTFGYASPQAPLASHADSLGRVLAGLPPATAISFVGHSMGNLVVRRWLQDAEPTIVRRINRMVMLGPPNQGSDLARLAASNHLLRNLASGAARELVLHWDSIRRELQTPPFQYGIIAGGKGDNEGYSLLLEGDDDAIVRVSETQLQGSDGFLVIPVRHSRMMENTDVQQETLRFLLHGRFAKKSFHTSLSEK